MKNSAIDGRPGGEAGSNGKRGDMQRGARRDWFREEGDTDHRTWDSLHVLFSVLPKQFCNSDVSLSLPVL